MKAELILFFLLPTLAWSFAATKLRRPLDYATVLYSSLYDNPVDDKLYQDYVDKWLSQREQLHLQDQQEERQRQQQPMDHQDDKPKVPTFSEADYLAAAKMRASQRPQSQNAQSKLEDWQTISDEKRKQYGVTNDDWDAAVRKEEAENWDNDD